MKYQCFIVLFLLHCNILFSQNNSDNFFFQKKSETQYACFGDCIIQHKVKKDTVEWVLEDEEAYISASKYFTYDTIYFDSFYIINNYKNLKFIIDYVDTSKVLLQISEADTRIVPCPDSILEYEIIYKDYIYQKSYYQWSLKDEENVHISSNWEKKQIEEKKIIKRNRLLTRYCDPSRVEIIPAHYISILKIKPKADLEAYQLANIQLLCKDYYINKKIKEKNEIIITKPAIKHQQEKTIILRDAMIREHEIVCDINENLIQEIQTHLKQKGYYKFEITKQLDENTQKAIVNYQIDYDLYIGQVTIQFINHLMP